MKKQLTIAQLMVVIAGCALAFAFAVLRYSPQVVVCAGPLAGSIPAVLRYLASIPRGIRLRAERSAAAIAYRPEPQPPRLPHPLRRR